MKKVYEAPAVEKIAFQYRDQVVVASGERCSVINEYKGTNECEVSNEFPMRTNDSLN